MDAERRKRINLYKKIVVTFVLLSILIPIALCIVLLAQMNGLKREVKRLYGIQNSYLERINELEEAQARIIQKTESEQVSTEPDRTAPSKTQAASDTGDELPTDAADNLQKDEENSGQLLEAAEDTKEEPSEEETVVPDTRKRVYLTFDDGPSSHTGEILDILKEYDAKATFFVNGKGSKFGDAYRRIVDEGHTLAMHSYTHVYGDVYSSVDAFMEDMHRLKDYLYDLTGYEASIYRFPGGSSNSITKINIREFGKALAEEGIVYFDWNVSSGDAVNNPPSADKIYNSVTKGILSKSTPVILMHDLASKKTTVEALPRILEFIRDNNCVAVGIDGTTDLVQHRKLEN